MEGVTNENMYGVLRTKHPAVDGSGFDTFKVYESFEEAQKAVSKEGGHIIKLVEVVEKSAPTKERSSVKS